MPLYKFAPFIRIRITELLIKTERLVALIGVVLIATWLYGARAFILCLLAAITAFICSLLSSYVKKDKGHADISDITSGILLALFCSVATNYFIIIIAVAIMILCIKLPSNYLHRLGFNINHTAATWLFMATFFTNQMFTYPAIDGNERLSLSFQPVFNTAKSAALCLSEGKVPTGGFMTILTANIVGPIGATAFIVLLSCFVYLVLREGTSWKVGLSMIVSSFLFSILFSRAGTQVLMTALFEIVSGSLMLSAVFLATDCGIFPKSSGAKWLYGSVLGILTMLIRYLTPFEQGAPLAILVCSLFIDQFDYLVYRLRLCRKYFRVYLKSKKIKKIPLENIS